MIRFVLFFVFCLASLGFANASPNVQRDSIGVKKNDGNFIMHKVKEGETFYRLSVKYRVSVEAIQAANPSIKTLAIPVGYMLNIPSQGEGTYISAPTARVSKISEKAGTAIAFKDEENRIHRNRNNAKQTANLSRYIEYKNVNDPSAPKRKFYAYRPVAERVGYIVQPGETVQSLCTRYVLTEDKLRAINDNMQGEVHPGQRIMLEIRMLTEEENESNVGWDMEQWMGLPDAGNLQTFGNIADERSGWKSHEQALEDEPLWTHTPPVTPGYELVHIIHTVEIGQQLQDIAKKYNTTTKELLELNNHQLGFGLKAGHDIIVGMEEIPLSEEKKARLGMTAGVSAASASEEAYFEGEYNATDETATTVVTTTNAKSNTFSTARGLAPNNTVVNETAVTAVIPQLHKNSVMATQVNNESKYGKNIAWHSQASLGAYIKITNPINGKATFAKVVGRPKDSTAIIEVDSEVAQYLEANTPKFEVLLEYND